MLTVVANASCTKLKLGAPLHFTQAMGTKTRMQQIRGTTQLRSTTTHVGCSLGSQKHAKTPYKPPECRMIFYTILKGSLLTFDLPDQSCRPGPATGSQRQCSTLLVSAKSQAANKHAQTTKKITWYNMESHAFCLVSSSTKEVVNHRV